MLLDMVFHVLLIAATLLCSLVAGLLFAFAVVVMPGITSLEDRGYLQAFKVMDRVIQDNQPLFMLAWIGSVVALVVSAGLGFWQWEAMARFYLMGITLIYLLGVQLPTVTMSIPLNNKLQAVDVDTLGENEGKELRGQFESRWKDRKSVV